MIDKQSNSREDLPKKFIPLDNGTESSKKWVELNDELFRRLAAEECFEQGLKETIQNFRVTLKRLSDGDGKRPTST